MAEFKLVIGDQKAKRTFKTEIKDQDAEQLIGKKIGETFRGELLGLVGYELEITGGSDKAGFPMLKTVPGAGRKKLLLVDGAAFHAKRKGQRRRKSVRGNTIAPDTVQINCRIVKWGNLDLMKHFSLVKEESPAEGEEKKEETAPAAAEVPVKESKPEESGSGEPKEEKSAEAETKEEAPAEPKQESAKPEQKEEQPAEEAPAEKE